MVVNIFGAMTFYIDPCLPSPSPSPSPSEALYPESLILSDLKLPIR